MSEAEVKQKVDQFLQLLPITSAIAGLPSAEPGKYYNDDQMEIRAQVLLKAYQHALRAIRELVKQ